jgi:signal transduction histidine kinase
MTHVVTATNSDPSLVLAGGGEMGALMRSIDWASTPLGPVSAWPQSLRTTVSTCLHSRFPILVWWGPELVMLYNDAYVTLIGGKHPQAVGSPGCDVFPEIWSIIGPMLEAVMTRGEATWSEDQLLLLERHGFAEECYFTFSYSPIGDESGGVGGVFTAVTETTGRIIGERRMATLRALAERTAPARAVAEAARCAVAALRDNSADVPFALLYLLDEQGRTARLADAAHLTAGTPGCPLEIPLDAAALDEPRGGATWPIAAVARTGRSQLVEVSELRPRLSDDPSWQGLANAIALPVAAAGQERPYGVLIAGVSPRLALDDAYRGFLDLIAGQVATGIANAEAYDAERRRAESLAELDRAKTTFFSNVSHEFRTPLTLLLAPLEDALRESDTSSPVHRELEMAHRNALRLLKLVNTLLDFSRIEAGRIEASYEPVDLGELTRDLASAFRSACERAGLRLNVEIPPSPLTAFVDRGMWEKIVLNLMSNAFKHTFAGGIDVRVSQRDGDALVEVADSGIGISAQELPHIFERFHRVPNARSRTHEGTGIGLSLVEELVRLHGGRIDVVSREGTGTTFSVHVPLGSAHLPRDRVGTMQHRPATVLGVLPYVEEALRWLPGVEVNASRGAESPDDASEPIATDETTRGARVLLADDNADMRDYVARLLRAQRWIVDTVADGRAALETARTSPPDIVLSDIMMPGLDGFGLVRALRANPATRAIPVILLSARAGEESRIEGMATGADDYLVKPFSARELVARVSAHLGLAAVRRQAAAEVEAAHAELTAAHMQLQAQARATDRALAALRVEQSRLTNLFRQAPAFICVLRGPEHVYEMANDSYRRLVGFRELIGRSVREALPEAAGQGFVELLDRVLANCETFVGRELAVVLQQSTDAAPEQRYLDFVYQPIVEADGSCSGIFVQGVDVTDQVLARGEIERARSEADSARHAAEQANQSKSDFLAAMSHELRTPLNAIAGYAELLEVGVHGPLNDSQRDAVRRIRRSEEVLLGRINDVLNFAKIEAGRVEYHIDVVPLADAVAAVAPLIETQFAAKRLDYVTRVAPDVLVRTDRDKLQQILINLLSNAVKFTESGGTVTIDMGTRPGAPPGFALLRVSDTGIGIPREKQDSVFDPFIQVHRRLTSSTEGTGLGLAISRDLARGMGGELRVRSVEGEGSTFTLALPLAN